MLFLLDIQHPLFLKTEHTSGSRLSFFFSSNAWKLVLFMINFILCSEVIKFPYKYKYKYPYNRGIKNLSVWIEWNLDQRAPDLKALD